MALDIFSPFLMYLYEMFFLFPVTKVTMRLRSLGSAIAVIYGLRG